MRQVSILIIAFVSHVFIGYSQAPYKINSCKIDFVSAAGTFQHGTKTLIFTDSGRTEKEYGTSYRDTSAMSEFPKEVIGDRMVYHALLIHAHNTLYSIDLDLKTGTKTVYVSLDSSFLKNNMDLKKIRTDTFLNRNCDVYDLDGVKLWYWKGIVIKKELPIEGVYEYATAIDENYVIKDDEFEIPKDVQIQ